MGREGKRLRRPGLMRARVEWGFLIFLFILAYILFALAFISIRLWLLASTGLWRLVLCWRRAALNGHHGHGRPWLLPRALREEGAEERLEELIRRNREILERYGWLP
ncbi:TPA: hypothetical protein EYP12_01850 [Candidatus Bipolaricaulota bacterium]|nr:hypothetical protein [Candidatus Bipolaricaulota bacterium]